MTTIQYIFTALAIWFLLLACRADLPQSPRSGPPFAYQSDAAAYWRTHQPPLPMTGTSKSVPVLPQTGFVVTAHFNWSPYFTNGAIEWSTDLHNWQTGAVTGIVTDGTPLTWTDSVPRMANNYRAVNLP